MRRFTMPGPRRTLRARLAAAGRWVLLTLATAATTAAPAHADELPEYRLKAAFVYNFLVYTDWPAELGPTLTLCIHGSDPFGKEIDALQGRPVGARSVAVQRRGGGDTLKGCQAVFLPNGALDVAQRQLEAMRTQPMLTLSDAAGAARRGVMLNLQVQGGKVVFEANLQSTRAAGLGLSAKLLRLATEVHQ